MKTLTDQTRCPICGTCVPLASPLPHWFPFCSRQCQLVDLGRWLNEEYSISRPFEESELEEDIADDGQICN